MISISINIIDTYFHAMFYSIDNKRHSVAIITTIKNKKCNNFIYILSNYDQMTFWNRFTYLFLQIESELCYFFFFSILGVFVASAPRPTIRFFKQRSVQQLESE